MLFSLFLLPLTNFYTATKDRSTLVADEFYFLGIFLVVIIGLYCCEYTKGKKGLIFIIGIAVTLSSLMQCSRFVSSRVLCIVV